MGKYEVVQHIATGGMGMVFKARDTEKNREVAMKILSAETAAKPAMLERFKREARSAAKLHHENIVTTYDFGEVGGAWYIAMEFVEGIDLHEYVTDEGLLDPEEARFIILQGARALRHSSDQNIVHRDIKPSNFLLVPKKPHRPLVKLTDFGLAREIDADEFRVTRAGTTVGTIDYMSPEQARDSSAADIRSDLYSLGSTWYHLLVGHSPFSEGGLGERLIRIMNDDPPDPREANPRISDRTWAILSKLLAKDPDDRYQTPGELVEDLLELEGKATAKPKRGAKTPQKKGARKGSSGAETETAARTPSRIKAAAARSTRMRLWYAVAGGAVFLALVIVIAVSLRKSSKRAEKNDPPVVQPGDGDNGSKDGERPPADKGTNPDEKDRTKDKDKHKPPHPVVKVRWPALYKPSTPFNVKGMRQEVETPWAGAEESPADPFVARVSRSPGTGSVFPSLAAACAAAPAGRAIVLEIHDNGPIFEMPAAVAGRDLTIRAGAGYRPLLVWDLPATVAERAKLKKNDQPLVFLRMEKGRLAVEGIELCLRWPDTLAEGATLFGVQDGELSLRDCTISAVGKPRDGVTVARFQGSNDKARCRFTRCQARGNGLTALDLDAPGEVLVDGCLLVGSDRPLVRIRAAAKKGPRVRVVRSTLVCAQTMLEVRPTEEGERIPAVSWLGWDSLFSRSAAVEGGELVNLPGGGDSRNIDWRAVNCLYAGWKNLLGGSKSIPSGDEGLRDWQRHWKRIEGDGVARDPWPDQVFNEPATQPAATYQPIKPVAWASTLSDEEPLGCDLKALPAARDGWQALALEPVVSPPEAPSDNSAPAIPMPGDGRFHGTRLELKADRDLGSSLAQMQERFRLGPRVVMRLTGKGEQFTSPIRIKGASLVLFFEEPADKKTPPLVLKLGRSNAAVPLIDIEDGNLEIINGTLRTADSAGTQLSHLIKVKGGDIKLYRTRLEGPQQAVPDGYRSAIALVGSGDPSAEKARTCALNECVVLSSRAGILLDGVGSRLLVRQSVIVSGTEALHLLPGPSCKGKAGMNCVLEQVTFAARAAVAFLGNAPAAGVVAEPVVVQARHCAYLNPFPGKPSKAGLLLAEGEALSRGLLLWQGEHEGFDQRLYFAVGRKDMPLPSTKVGHAPWKRLWGSFGVRDPRPELVTRMLEFDPRRWALERLILPIREPPGANLKALDIVPRKPR
jgi:serine/threonine-protein kinase